MNFKPIITVVLIVFVVLASLSAALLYYKDIQEADEPENIGGQDVPIQQLVEEKPAGQCYIAGCSSQICSDQENVITTCEYNPEYACYKEAKCERQTDGQCGWTQTDELKACLENPPSQEESALEVKPFFEAVAQDLKIPWEVVFLPRLAEASGEGGLDNTILITERPGELAILKDGNIKRIPVEGVYHIGEGGLMGLALHPNFSENKFLYLYMTYQDGGNIKNKVERYKFENDALSEKKVIIDDIPGAANHNGGRVIFGPDNHLYITTGDADSSYLAQNQNSLAGKILRITDEGNIPVDNPFNNATYSYGHRNVQGLAFDDKGRLWATEHGRSGFLSGYDELNLTEKGKNYGWPEIQGDETRAGMEKPVLHSGPNTTWAPAGLIFNNGKLYFAGLRGETLYEVNVVENSAENLKENFVGEFGRIRAVVKGADENIYITTSNTDGRGKPKENDDKLIRIKFRSMESTQNESTTAP